MPKSPNTWFVAAASVDWDFGLDSLMRVVGLFDESETCDRLERECCAKTLTSDKSP